VTSLKFFRERLDSAHHPPWCGPGRTALPEIDRPDAFPGSRRRAAVLDSLSPPGTWVLCGG